MSSIPSYKYQIIDLVKELQDNESSKVTELKELVLQKDKRIKELEDKFGVTKKKEWNIRKLRWWMMWLSNHETYAYEYLMKFIHHELMSLTPTVLVSAKEGMKYIGKTYSNGHRFQELHTPMEDRSSHMNVYGVRLTSYFTWGGVAYDNLATTSNNKTGGRRYCRHPTKNELITCCKENQIKYKSQWKKDKIFHAIINHREPSNDVVNVEELTIEGLKELIRIRMEEENV